jgi:hypothetical protein
MCGILSLCTNVRFTLLHSRTMGNIENHRFVPLKRTVITVPHRSSRVIWFSLLLVPKIRDNNGWTISCDTTRIVRLYTCCSRSCKFCVPLISELSLIFLHLMNFETLLLVRILDTFLMGAMSGSCASYSLYTQRNRSCKFTLIENTAFIRRAAM